MIVFRDLCDTYSHFSPSDLYTNFMKYKSQYIPSSVSDPNILLCYKYTFFYVFTDSKVKIKTFCGDKIKEKIFKTCLREVRNNMKEYKKTVEGKSQNEFTPICNLYSLHK
ncbi:uncharacterized protein VNE69_12157 [Vairimorpha necatrix]|uniref:Uncharacterized protein n=1 Tax=Vairimorpha necatrix TaxID=6039 RepID=A0AAX4JGV0_9MICR